MPTAIDGNVTPAQIRNIADTQSAIAGKQKCLAYVFLDIGSLLQLADFFKGQKLTFAFRLLYLLVVLRVNVRVSPASLGRVIESENSAVLQLLL